MFAVAAIALTAPAAVLLIAGGSSRADSPPPCLSITSLSAPPRTEASSGATPTPRVIFATFCNTHSETVDGLRFTVTGIGEAHTVENPAGCDYPDISLAEHRIVDVKWPNACVAPNASVTMGFDDCSSPPSPACGYPRAVCYTWETGGLPDPSPCDFCPTGEPVDGHACEFASGDINCDNHNYSADAVDALGILRHVAGLGVSQEPGCPSVGAGSPTQFGDLDCNGSVDPVDALRILRFVADLSNPLFEGCWAIGQR
ncbi:MAG TPA: hypothetical protein VLS25_07875 [Dehalococcoidia bacterium]|nr:hypothetical protein [Dehalococcoidia bacterium]